MTPDRPLHVLVVSYRHAGLLERCLDSVARHIPHAIVHVWDNESAGTPDVRALAARTPKVDWVFSPDNVGFAAGVNGLAARCGRGDLLLLNPDAVLVSSLPGCRTGLLAARSAGRRVAALAPLVEDPSREQAWDNARRRVTLLRGLVSYSGYSSRLRRYAVSDLYPSVPIGPVGFLSGECLLVNGDAWREIGPFDARYFLYAEEADWERRATDRGWTLLLVNEPGVKHRAQGTVDDDQALRSRSNQLLANSNVRLMRDHSGTVAAHLYQLGTGLMDRVQRSKRGARAR